MNKIFNVLSKYASTHNYLLFSIIYLFFGIAILIFNNKLFSSFISIILLVMLVSCIKGLIHLILNKEQNKLAIITALANTLLVCLALYFVEIQVALIIMLFAIYLTLNGIIKFINVYLYKKDNEKKIIGELIEGILYFTFGIVTFFAPNIHMQQMLIIIGIYLILLGGDYFLDFLDQNNIHIKRMRIPLPTFIDAFIPFSILKKVNHLSNENEIIDLNKKNEPVDLEIFVHVSEHAFGKFGHVDLCFKNEVLSYGNYDKDTRKLNEIFGSGVVFTTNKEDYIPFCIEYSNKTLFSFGIKLNQKQFKQVEEEINKIKENLVAWEPAYVKALKQNKKVKEENYQDYSSMLYKKAHATFYKFKTGKMKTYFVLGTNCGTLVDKIIRSSGADVLKMSGIITPGTYYDFLEREYMKKESNVVSKKIFNKDTLKKK
jgi:hypothetical protein